MVNATPNPIKEYYIAYFDILGYKEFFKQQPEKVPELLNAIHDAIRRTNNHIGAANASPLMHGVAGIEIKAKIFSDNILLCMEVTSIPNEPFRLFQFLQIVADIQRGFVTEYGLFVRGAITKGTMSFNDDYVFGQGIIDAVTMEESAIYPRIVISTDLANTLLSFTPYTQEDYNRAVIIENNYKAGKEIPVNEQVFYGQMCSLRMADVYYKYAISRLILLWRDNNWILCYLYRFDVSELLGETVKASLLSSIQKISPSDYELLNQPGQPFDNALALHKMRVEEQLVKFGSNADIPTGDFKAAEVREKILRKYIWVMALHNQVCSNYNKTEYGILTRCNCDARFLKMTIEVLKDEAGV